MNQELRKDAEQIIDVAIASVQPDAAVRRALSNLVFSEPCLYCGNRESRMADGKCCGFLFAGKWNSAMKKVWF